MTTKRRRAPSLPEGPFQRALEIALNAPTRATRVQRMNSGELLVEQHGSTRMVRLARPGTGDLLGYVAPDGVHVEVECKRLGGVSSEAQLARAREAQRSGWVYVVVEGPADADGLGEAVRIAVARVDAAIAERRAR